MKRFLAFTLCFSSLILSLSLPLLSHRVQASQNSSTDFLISAPCALLMEASTGTILYEKNIHEQVRPASITKIMTLLLIFDALEHNHLSLNDTVSVSAHAASMGGSQVFLEAGETQTVETMIKCISVASANDACVAMAEHLCGSEEAFVKKMNQRAKELGMSDTNFINCCGLDTDGHVTSAYDVSLMSRELITKHPQIHNYSTIWMENIVHNTAKGNTEFGLTNTNKLIKQYPYATGLKTGSTNLAKYCLSATASKDGLDLIAVIMGAPDYKVRFTDATTLLNYGFSNCNLYTDKNIDAPAPLELKKGTHSCVSLTYEKPFSYVSTNNSASDKIEKKITLPEYATAPVKAGDIAGKATYFYNGTQIGYVNILYSQTISAATFMDCFKKILTYYLS